MVLNDGVSLLSEVYSEVVLIQNWNEINTASLPIQREFIHIKLELCQLLTDMLETELEQIVDKNESDHNKESAIKVSIYFFRLVKKTFNISFIYNKRLLRTI